MEHRARAPPARRSPRGCRRRSPRCPAATCCSPMRSAGVRRASSRRRSPAASGSEAGAARPSCRGHAVGRGGGRVRAQVHVARLRPDEPTVRPLLVDVRAPAGGAGRRERRREERPREAEGLEQHGRVELDVRLERAIRMPRRELRFRFLLDGAREAEPAADGRAVSDAASSSAMARSSTNARGSRTR